MKPWIRLDHGRTPDGTLIELYQRDGELVIRTDGQVLMGTRAMRSETALAGLAIDALGARRGARVLIGGLGCGYTLRAALDRLPPTASVTVSELVEAVVEWNRGPLGEHAGHPLSDPRVTVIVGDIIDLLRNPSSRYDLVLLDVDNGPEGLTQESNEWLYSAAGLSRVARVLGRGGVVAVWSAGEDTGFGDRLKRAGFAVVCHRVRSHTTRKGSHHVIWVGRRTKS